MRKVAVPSPSAGHVFGPVASRRLGLSLGVDLVPFKTCSYDCVYCQCGRTTDLTVKRQAYVPLDQVIEECRVKLKNGPRPNYVTLSGSGEPTLHAGLGECIAGLKQLTDVPVAVLTNGSLLALPEVRRELSEADLVIPSLDAGNADTFRRVNRPHRSAEFEAMVEGLVSFGRDYTGLVWLEVLLLDGLTSDDEEVRRIARHAARIAPNRVQLNTVARPPAESMARAVPAECLRRLASFFSGPIDILADETFASGALSSDCEAQAAELLDLIRRRPATEEHVARGLGLDPYDAHLLLRQLEQDDLILTETLHGQVYFRAVMPRRERTEKTKTKIDERKSQ